MNTTGKEINENLRKHTISPESTIREAMKCLNELSGDSMTLFVTTPHGEIKGSITDGDIRRTLIDGGDLQDPVSIVMNTAFKFVTPEDDISKKISEARKRHIELLPVVENGELMDFIDLRHVKTHIPVEVVLMAGGRGERLRPLTDTIPKPLLPVDGKPIIDYNVEELEACGVKKIYVTVNYLADLIRDHFNSHKGSATVECVEEPKKLGTLGSLAYVKEIKTDNLIVMNSDLLTTVDFEALYLHHVKSGADFTIAAVPYSVSIPFAIMRLKKDRVTSLEEKPTYNYFANGGVYIMKTELIERIPEGQYLDAPDFIMSLIKDGKNVGCFHLEGTWIDIGSPDDYRMACELMARRR